MLEAPRAAEQRPRLAGFVAVAISQAVVAVKNGRQLAVIQLDQGVHALPAGPHAGPAAVTLCLVHMVDEGSDPASPIDLDQHDLLMNALPQLYQQVYGSQTNRPSGMGFFEFVVSDIHGIRVRKLRQHAARGGKVVATYCVFAPDEVVLAAGAIPVGLYAGSQFSVPMAEEVLPRNKCALIKSSFGFRLGRTCPYVQSGHLIVGETTCDGKGWPRRALLAS